MISNKLNNLVSESTAFGIPNIVRRERIFNKILWLSFVLSGTLASIFFTIQALNDYFEFDTITKIGYKYQNPLQFPAFTICSDENPYYFEKKNIRELISDCQIRLDYTCIKKVENYFELIKYRDMGTCYRFNSGKNIKGNMIPFLYSTIGGRDDYFEIKFKNNSGLRLVMHEFDLPPKFEYFNIHETVISLSNYSRFFIIIDKTIENKLGLPYNDCYENISDFDLNKTIVDHIQLMNQTYTQVNCFKLCFELVYIEKNPCNCSNTTLGNVWSDCFFNFEKHSLSSCTMEFKENFTANSVVEKCEQYCPLECDSTFYTHSISLAAYHNDPATSFRVFFSSLKVATISETPKTQLFDLISNIGGIFGLFIGISFVTLFELAEIFIEIIFSIFQRNNNKVEIIENENKRIRNEIISEVKNQFKIELDQLEKKFIGSIKGSSKNHRINR